MTTSWKLHDPVRPASMTAFRFIVVADSHVRLPDDDIATYPSNALMVERNRFVVDLCNQIDAEFVIHLGDVVHPLPVEESHEAALDLAIRLRRDVGSGPKKDHSPKLLPIEHGSDEVSG